jgi:hypothetical protein
MQSAGRQGFSNPGQWTSSFVLLLKAEQIFKSWTTDFLEDLETTSLLFNPSIERAGQHMSLVSLLNTKQ